VRHRSRAEGASITVAPGQGKAATLITGNSDTSRPAFTVPALPAAGSSLYFGARVRVSGGSYYMVQARIQDSGAVSISVKRKSGTSSLDVLKPTPTGVQVRAGDSLVVAATASGTTTVGVSGTVQNLRTGAAKTAGFSDTSAQRLAKTAAADAWLYTSASLNRTVTVPVQNAPASPAPAPAPAPQPGPGVPAGTALKVHEGDLIITEPNTVVRGLEIRGFVRVNAPGAVIENSKIIGRSTNTSVGIISNYNNGNSFTVRNSEITAAAASPYLNGIMGHNFRATNVWIHGVIDSVRITGSNVTVENSTLEKNVHFASDPTQGNTPSHDDSIQIQGGSNIRIVGNKITGAFNAAVQITQGLGRVSDVTIAGNYLNNGGCTINIHETSKGVISNVVISANVFGPNRRVDGCAVVAPTSSYPAMSGNTWESTAKAVGITRG